MNSTESATCPSNTTPDATTVAALREPNPAPRCKHVTEVDWPGHRACLYRKRCKNHTKDPSGLCHAHRPSGSLGG